MLTPILDSGCKTPLYQQLYWYLRTEIEACNLPEGFRLPSKRKFASHLHISKSTIEAAYAQLIAEGYIYSREKYGYYVCRLEKNSFALPNPAKEVKTYSEFYNSETSYRYTLSTGKIATSHFPFSVWAKLMREVLNTESENLLAPVEPQGDYELRLEIVRYLHAFRGIEAAPEQILLGAGSEYLLGLLTQLLPRDCIYACEDPGYQKTAHILSANGLSTIPVPLDCNGMDVNALKASNAKIVHITPSHHFPLGIVTPIGRRQELLAWAAAADRYIIEDDYDSEFRFSGKPIPALKSLDAGEKVIYLNTFAKTLAPSLRISYMVLPTHLIRRYHKNLFFYSCTIPSFEQRTLALFLRRGYFERHLSRMRKIYKLRRDTFMEGFLPYRGKILFSGTNSGPHLLLTVRNGMAENELIESAAEKGIRLFPLSNYYASAIAPASTVVTGYAGYSTEDLKTIASLLCSAWF